MYKVGDVVLIRADLAKFEMNDFPVCLLKSMKKCSGKVAVITKAWKNCDGDNSYLINISSYYWEDALFVPYSLDKFKEYLVSMCSK